MRWLPWAAAVAVCGCAGTTDWTAGSADDAREAAVLLGRYGIETQVSAVRPGAIELEEADASAALDFLTRAGFGVPAADPAPRLVLGPTEARRAALQAELRRVEAALRATPGVLRAQVVATGPAPAAIVFHEAGAELPAVRGLVLAALGPEAQVTLRPVEPPPARTAAPRASLEWPLAALCLVLSVLMGLVVRGARRRVPA